MKVVSTTPAAQQKIEVITTTVKQQMLADALDMSPEQWYEKHQVGDYYQYYETAVRQALREAPALADFSL